MQELSKSAELSPWQLLGTIATIESPWVTVKCERWQDDQEKELEYWRVNRPDSIIVIPMHKGHFLLPRPIFRPGVEVCTWDFPGGRLQAGFSHEEMAIQLLHKELGMRREDIDAITPINNEGYFVDSSFSSQRVWGYVAVLHKNCKVDESAVGWKVPATEQGCSKLLDKLHCLQCRELLLELLNLRKRF